LQLLDRLGCVAFREQDLAELIARVGEVRLRLERASQQWKRLLTTPVAVEDGRESVLRLGVVRTHPKLRSQRLLGLGQPALLQVEDAQRGIGLRHVRIQLERPCELADRSFVVSLLCAGLTQHHPHLGRVAMAREQAGEDRLGLGATVAARESETVRELQRRGRRLARDRRAAARRPCRRPRC
jgi:hypothetical protein